MPHRRILRTEIREDVSELLRTFAALYWPAAVARGTPQALVNLCHDASALVADREDWETPARAAGWLPEPGDTLGRVYLDRTARDGEDESYYHAADWREACDRLRLVPAMRPVAQLWSVSEWLGDRLEEQGERVRGFAGLRIWARMEGTPLEADEIVKAIWRSVTDMPDHDGDGDNPR